MIKKILVLITIISLIFIISGCQFLKKNSSQTLNKKTLSILGDSISTYPGYSNDGTNTNNTIGNNVIYYTGSNYGFTSVDQTWWRQLANNTDLNVLVNNSYSGSRVLNNEAGINSAGYLRANQLHDNTGNNSGTKPDIIAVFIGINDFNYNLPLGIYNEEIYNKIIQNNDGTFSYLEPTNFNEAYAIMLHKITSTYDKADVYCFTLLPNGYNTNYSLLEEFNNSIRNIANHYNVKIVDLYKDSGITTSNYLDYSNDPTGLHPNANGMNAIFETFKKVLRNTYTLKE